LEQVLSQIRRSISLTEVKELNTRDNRRTPEINWGQSYSWILVGGQSMDRGFTVEGLTVTYMPRSLGLGNADTVQQRARFFGYKRKYLGLCRIFLGPDVAQAFRSYVEHEEDIRTELSDFARTQRPLSEWRREFFLSRELRPTRDNVIAVAYRQIRLGDQWVYPHGPHDSADAISANAALFNQFRGAHLFHVHDGLDLRQNSLRNQVIEGIPMQIVHEQLLTRYRVSRLEDSQHFGAMLRVVKVCLIDNPNATCSVFLLAEGVPRRRDYNGQILQLFQGRQYAHVNGERIVTYPGDREVRGANGITVHMGYLDLGKPAAIEARNIPHLAVWVPANMARDAISQPQGG
jgi:hypothetical protein